MVAPLSTRIGLLVGHSRRPGVPRVADGVKGTGPIAPYLTGNKGRGLYRRRPKALAAIRGNVTVHGPDAWVVKGPCDSHEPVGRHLARLAARRVRQLPPVRGPSHCS